MDFRNLLGKLNQLNEGVEVVAEKITSKTDMGKVIKDFQKSDAPQFKGKSKDKRREMAIAAKLSKESVEEADLRRLAGLPEASIQEATMDLSDKTEELTQWVLKYDGYRGDNGDALPMGWIKSMTATGVGPDGWEVKEWNRYQDKLGKDMTTMDDAEIDAFLDNPQNSPVTSAMIDDLLKITGASTADEDLARAVSSAIGIGESIQEATIDADTVQQIMKRKQELKAQGIRGDIAQDKAAEEMGIDPQALSDYLDDQLAIFPEEPLTAEIVQRIMNRKEELVDQGMEPEEAQDQAAEELEVDPEELADYLDSQYDESVSLGEGPTQMDSETVEAIMKLKEVYMDKGMEPEEAQDEAAEQFGIDPEELADYLDSQYDEGIKSDFDRDSFRESFMRMVEAKSKKKMPMGPGPDGKKGTKDDKPAFLDQKTGKKSKSDKEESGKKGMSDKQKKYFGKKDESVEEGSISRKFMKAMSWSKDTTGSPKDMQAGIRKMSDKELLDLMRGDNAEAPSGSARSAQNKMINRELKRRGIGESVKEGKNKHASMNESFDRFFAGDKLTFEEAVKIVRESGGQQKIDPVDTALWNWAQRVAANKFTESRKAEMYAGLIYERNGGEFQLYDILSESTVKKSKGISESVQNFTGVGIPKEYAERFLKKYQVKHDAKISPTDGVPKASDIRRDSFIINVLPNGDVRGFGKKGDDWKVGKNFYSVLHMVDGKFTDTGYESLSAAKQGMSKQGKFYTLDGNMWSFYRDKKPDSARDTRGDVMTGDGNIYGYMNNTFMTKMRPMMEKMVDDIYANLRKLDNKNKTYYSPSDQERALEAAQTIEAIAERGFNRATMENFLTHLKRASYGFASIPANERELRKILKDTPNARAKWAKTILDAAKRQHERVKQMLYGPTVNALKGEPENA